MMQIHITIVKEKTGKYARLCFSVKLPKTWKKLLSPQKSMKNL